jgi:hypothetical protein
MERRRPLGAAAHFCGLRFGWIQVQALCSGPMKRSLALITLSLAAATAFATTYVRVEKDGTKTYSDRPIPGGAPIEIQSAQTYSAPVSAAPAAPALSREQQLLKDMGEPIPYESCALTPATEQTFTNPESVSLAVTLKPPRRVGDVVDLRLDGAPVGGENALSFLMKPVPRGTHKVSVAVKDRYGRALCDASSTFYVFQPGLNSPARQAPPPKPKPKGG